MTKEGRSLATALLLTVFPVAATAASGPLSFTANSLNLSPAGALPVLGFLTVDGQGNAFQAGYVTDPSGVPVTQVMKTNPLGQVVASYTLGSQARVTLAGLLVSQDGSVVVVGQGYEADFPTATVYGPATAYPAGFVIKLDTGLTAITASAVIGGNQPALSYVAPQTGAGAVSVDAAGNIYVAAETTMTDIPVTSGTYETTGGGGAAILAELSPGLDRIMFSTYIGNALTRLRVDAAGAVIGTGAYSYPVSVPTIHSAIALATKVMKFAPGSGTVLWTTVLAPPSGPPSGEEGGYASVSGLALDADGDVVLAGGGNNGATPTPSALESCPGYGYTGFVAKLSGSSGAVEFLTNFGCEQSLTVLIPPVNSVAIDASGTIWITGVADPSTLPAATMSSGSGPTYLAALAPDGSSVEALYMSAAGVFGMSGQGLALNSAGNPVVLDSAGFLMLSSTSGGPSLLGVANSAASSVSGLIAPAELVSFYGTCLGPTSPLGEQVVGGVVQSALGGYQLQIGGVAAPLLYISQNQINAVVPSEVVGQDSVPVSLVTPAGTFPLANLYVRPAEPAIFCGAVSGYAAAINQDGTLNSASNPAHAGEIVSVWGTGAGAPGNLSFPPDGTVIEATEPFVYHVPALPVSIITGSVLAGYDSLEVDYAGDAPDEVFGAMQVNFQLPQPLPSAALTSGTLAVSLEVGGAIGDPVSIYIAQ